MDKHLWLGELLDEWLNHEVKSQALADYEFSGLLMGMRANVTNRLKAARRLMKLWPFTSYHEEFEFTPAISLTTSKNRKPYVKISCPRKILKAPKTLRHSWAWLKGIWGSAGGLYFPKNGYHLAIINSDSQVSKILRHSTNLTGLAWIERRNEFSLRNHDDITTFLCNTGMSESSLRLIELSLIRSERSRANVMSNYEAANIARTIKAAHEQIMMAQKILEAGKLEELPEKFREVVLARLENPDATLDEIGQKLKPPVSKSTVKYRLNKIRNSISQNISR